MTREEKERIRAVIRLVIQEVKDADTHRPKRGSTGYEKPKLTRLGRVLVEEGYAPQAIAALTRGGSTND